MNYAALMDNGFDFSKNLLKAPAPAKAGGFSFFDFLGDSFNKVTQWGNKEIAKNGARTNFDRLIDLGGLAGGLWGGYEEQKMAKKNFKLQEDAYNFNKYLAQEELRRRQNRENNLKEVWS
ncbi:hypothetical protein [Campylobacter armoricus]|uniref:Uncharacterized protein n=1 Tax=Campylobacter armoricus TaxID=2505970 RepID=A0A7L5HX32_9BACT|nr:hypothetical protein [Campylobacter armoricus]QKF79556.1 hypothetical protein CARM_0638 [Campylobacter armoricus]